MPSITQTVTVTVQNEVLSNSPKDPRLAKYPRPKDDNGISICFRQNVVESDNKPYVSQGIEWLQEIHAKWTLLMVTDWLQLGKFAPMIYGAGVMPTVRLICKIDKPYIDWETGVKVMLDLGIPPYQCLFNEPGDSREWNPKTKNRIARFGAAWANAAARVFDAGGYPGIQVLGEDEWLSAFNAVKANGRMDIWSKAWFCLHNYGSNHPSSYPYDDVNQNGTPVTQTEYDAAAASGGAFSLPIDEVNALRYKTAITGTPNPKNKNEEPHHGQTIMDDDTSVIRFLEYMQWMKRDLGFSLPFISGEGGWEWGNEEDHRYPKLSPDQHASFHKGIFEWFSTGVISTGQPLPDELFNVAPWIMSDGGADSWWYDVLGTKQKTIDAVASIPPFIRQFSGVM